MTKNVDPKANDAFLREAFRKMNPHQAQEIQDACVPLTGEPFVSVRTISRH